MGNCCNANNIIEKTVTEAQMNQDEEEEDNNIVFNQNNSKYLISSVIEDKRINTEIIKTKKTWGQQKDTVTNKNNMTIDRPDVIDKLSIDNNKYENSLNMSIEDTDLGINLSSMENNLFNIINELRNDPKSFISKVEKYKDMLKNDDDRYYILIDENEFEFKEGKECFDECIDFLKEQKTLENFSKSSSMFECKKFFVDKNVSDLFSNHIKLKPTNDKLDGMICLFLMNLGYIEDYETNKKFCKNIFHFLLKLMGLSKVNFQILITLFSLIVLKKPDKSPNKDEVLEAVKKISDDEKDLEIVETFLKKIYYINDK